VESVRGQFMIFGHPQIQRGLRNSIDKFEVKSLRERCMSAAITYSENRTHHVAYGFELDSSRHAAGCPGLLNPCFVNLKRITVGS
jgi:hypothetical protein